jgi:hypothetical protein
LRSIKVTNAGWLTTDVNCLVERTIALLFYFLWQLRNVIFVLFVFKLSNSIATSAEVDRLALFLHSFPWTFDDTHQ